VLHLAQGAQAAAAGLIVLSTTFTQVYDKAKISAIKHRSVRREARIMRYLTDKR
jgi:hypothetical protein